MATVPPLPRRTECAGIWTYDNGYQLTREQLDGDDAYDYTYTYDPVGNMTGIRGDGDGVRVTSTFDAANQQLTAKGTTSRSTFVYDANGNRLQRLRPTDRYTHVWDDENRMLKVAYPWGPIHTYTYNADGLRVKKLRGSTTTKFVWDLENLERETDENDVGKALYATTPETYGEVLSQRRNGATKLYHYDGTGSTTRITQITGGTVIDTYRYRAYGRQVASTGGTTNWLRYKGRWGYYRDNDSTMFYQRARYKTMANNFLSTDPLGVAAGVNLYLYVTNNPINRADPGRLLPRPTTPVRA